jgi:hypothetical protein
VWYNHYIIRKKDPLCQILQQIFSTDLRKITYSTARHNTSSGWHWHKATRPSLRFFYFSPRFITVLGSFHSAQQVSHTYPASIKVPVEQAYSRLKHWCWCLRGCGVCRNYHVLGLYTTYATAQNMFGSRIVQCFKHAEQETHCWRWDTCEIRHCEVSALRHIPEGWHFYTRRSENYKSQIQGCL